MEYKQIVREKCTLKEFHFLSLLSTYNYSDMLFITSYGQVIGKPYKETDEFEVASQIILSDVIIINNAGIKTVYHGSVFNLFIDQVIMMMQIDRENFLSQY